MTWQPASPYLSSMLEKYISIYPQVIVCRRSTIRVKLLNDAILKTDVAEHEIHLQQKCKWNFCFTQRVQPAKVVDVRFYKRDLA